MSSQNIVRRFLAARPIWLDKREVETFVGQRLVPTIARWLRRQKADKPLGTTKGITWDDFEVTEADGKNTHTVRITVESRSATGKMAAVLGGWSRKGQVGLVLNGALTPAEFLTEESAGEDLKSYVPARMQPIHSCKHETCLPYGLYSILIHELTHEADVYRKSLTYSPEAELRDKKDFSEEYANDPAEVRAHMQQIVDEAVTNAKNPMLGNAAKGDTNKLIQMALKLSTTWRILEPKLTPSNRNKILKAVYDGMVRAGIVEA